MTKKPLALTILFLVTCFEYALAQQLPDSTAYNTALAQYLNVSGEQSELFNGSEYFDLHVGKGSVFFLDNNNWTPTTVTFRGLIYKDIPAVYDSYKDVLVLRRPNGVTKYILWPEKTTDFIIGGHHFIRLYPGEFKNAAKEGYYEELYDGKSTVIVKRSKERSESVSQQEGIKVIFDDLNTIYIKKDGIYNPVKSRGDVLKLFKDKADALNKYLKSSGIKFNENREQAIVKLANYYDQLSL